jgi:hypothetical protein
MTTYLFALPFKLMFGRFHYYPAAKVGHRDQKFITQAL